MSKEVTYTCLGLVRGCCDKEHASVGEAIECITADMSGCVQHGGYSDRLVYSRTAQQRADGTPWIESIGQPPRAYTARHCELVTDADVLEAVQDATPAP